MKFRYPTNTIPLPKQGSWPDSFHVFDNQHGYALMAAEAAGRPLLLRGEPGTGKSQLARAAAVATGRLFLSVVVNARTECEDLQWKFDAVGRLGEAQILASIPDADRLARLRPARFLSPGPLWWALNWHTAEQQFIEFINPSDPAPDFSEGWEPSCGSVLLIDEIDKADTDLPNSLLETLGNGDFKVPYIGGSVCRQTEVPAPLVVITTNEERELPAAFIRRCLVLQLTLPEKKDELIQFLSSRGKAHVGDEKCSDKVRKRAAELLVEDRLAVEPGQLRPGQAEYIDLLKAITGMVKDEEIQIEFEERQKTKIKKLTKENEIEEEKEKLKEQSQIELLDVLRRFVYRK
ncbi:MAG: MoxR family ATPase [Methylococcales bacterium]|nr:MoxR family ATPase [Methylococcales bacterium]